jgi:hypothetical protein
MDVRPLLDYFRGRRVWVAEPDAIPQRMAPYNGFPPTMIAGGRSLFFGSWIKQTD